MRWPVIVLLPCSLLLGACSRSSGSTESTGPAQPTAAAAVGWTPPPVNASFDYQLGGDYPPPDGVTVVARDVTGQAAEGTYGICYVNAFQTQPGQRDSWPADLVTDFEDPNFPDEYLLDISTPSKREKAAAVLTQQIDTCAAKGFRAVELDNLDSWTRMDGTDREGEVPFGIDEAADFAHRLATIAHGRGLAVGQKNTPQLGARRTAQVGFDFAVAEECGRYDECGVYQAVHGDHLIDIEYDRESFDAACTSIGADVSIVFRDVDVSPPDSPTYQFASC